MNYTIIAFLLLVALTCSTARSVDASEKEVQEIREETPSSNEDALFSLSANEDEEARGRLQAFLAKMKEIAAQTLGREEIFSANEDEEARRGLHPLIAKMKKFSRILLEMSKKASGRNEEIPEISANEDEEARGRLQAFLAKMKEIAAQTLGREEIFSVNEDEEARGRLQAFIAKMKEFIRRLREMRKKASGRNEEVPEISANDDEEERLVWLLPLKFLASHVAMEGLSKVGSKIASKLGRSEETPVSFSAEEEERLVWLLPLKFLASHIAMEGLSKVGSKIASKLGRSEETPVSFSADDDEEERAGLGKIGALIKKALSKMKEAGRNEETTSEILSASDDEEARKVKWWKAMKSVAKFIAKEQMKKHLGGEK